jgi:hypothetical protein
LIAMPVASTVPVLDWQLSVQRPGSGSSAED